MPKKGPGRQQGYCKVRVDSMIREVRRFYGRVAQQLAHSRCVFHSTQCPGPNTLDPLTRVLPDCLTQLWSRNTIAGSEPSL
jgi:hypothetical protein